jgi:hypothetical protein
MRYLLVSALLLLSCSCTMLRARAYGGLSVTELSGDAALNSSAGNLNLGANRVDVERELGQDDREVSPYLRAELGIPIGAVTLSGFGYSQTGRGALDGDSQFGDLVGGTQVTSHLAFTNIKAAAHFDLFNFGILRLSPGVGVDFIDLDVEVGQVGTGSFERINNEVFVPMLFAQAEADLGVVAATVDFGYMQASLEDARGRYMDLEALLRINPLPMLEIFAGYRWIDVAAKGNADERRYEADLVLRGWMLGGGVTF